MRVVQALYWLRDMLPSNHDRIVSRLKAILNEPKHGPTIRADLRSGLHTLPIWMQRIVRQLLQPANENNSSRPNSKQLDLLKKESGA